jgi:hypothetical protein
MPAAPLHPNPAFGDAATLSVADGWLVATLPDGTSERFRIGPEGVTVLAHYTTVVLPPPGSSVRRVGVGRSGWRLLDPSGHAVAWLGNTDRPLYDGDAARRFAATWARSCPASWPPPAPTVRSTAQAPARSPPGWRRLSSGR